MTQPRVLLVEDDPSVRRFVQMALDPLGVNLVPCATLAEAKQALTTEVAPLVLTDLTLPDGALMACVSETLVSLDLGAQADSAVVTVAQHNPVAEFFGGNRALYEAYRQACLARFPQDVMEGDLAVAAQDAQALRRVAHNLKSVLTMLGEAPAAQCARSTEEWAAGGDSDLMQQGWRGFCSRRKLNPLHLANGCLLPVRGSFHSF